MKHFLLFYEVAPDYLKRRTDFRAAHLRHAWESHTRGELILGGALADPADSAILLFRGDDSSAARAFATTDPYVTNGLVENWHVREWATVVGDHAAEPLRL